MLQCPYPFPCLCCSLTLSPSVHEVLLVVVGQDGSLTNHTSNVHLLIVVLDLPSGLGGHVDRHTFPTCAVTEQGSGMWEGYGLEGVGGMRGWEECGCGRAVGVGGVWVWEGCGGGRSVGVGGMRGWEECECGRDAGVGGVWGWEGCRGGRSVGVGGMRVWEYGMDMGVEGMRGEKAEAYQLPSPSCSTASSKRTSSMAPQSSVSKEKLPSSYKACDYHVTVGTPSYSLPE